jgi:hypothetical protein
MPAMIRRERCTLFGFTLARRRTLHALLPLLFMTALTACGDGVFVSPAATPARLGLAFSMAAAASSAAAFDKATEAHIRVNGPGVAIDTLLPFTPAETRTVSLQLDGAQDGRSYTVEAELRHAGATLFRSRSTTTVSAGQTSTAEMALEPEPAQLSLPADAPPQMTVIGQTVQLFATFATGDTIAGTLVNWSSSNPAVATVDNTGRVTIVGDGQTVITARSGDRSVEVTIVVRETPPRTVRVCASGTGVAPTFPTLAVAVDSVASGGTIRFCTGTFAGDDRPITKPVTIEPEPGANATIDAGALQTTIALAHTTGTSTVRGISLIGGSVASVWAQGTYGNIIVENVASTSTGSGRNLYFGPNTSNAATITVRNVTVRGGSTGVFAASTPHLDVLDSRFENQLFANIQVQTDVSGSILRNTVTECGEFGCIRARFVGTLLIADNVARSTSRTNVFATGVQSGIVADGSNVRVERNLVEGIGTISNPADRAAYPFRDTGLLTWSSGGNPARATFIGNTVRNTATGIAASVAENGVSAHVIGSDNVIQNVETAVASIRGTFDLHRNDISGYVGSFYVEGPALAAGSVNCNWWGSAAGPGNSRGVDPAVYSPVAGAPIAGTSTACPPPGGTGTASLSGTIVSASTGQPVAGAVIELRQGGTIVRSATSSQEGAYSLTQLAGGTYTVRITATGYAEFSSDIAIGTDQQVSRTFAILPATTGGEVSIVLTWGAEPTDLDSYLEVPASGGTGPATIFYGNPGSASSYPFATLDVDDTDGFGPETIVIVQQLAGTYTYSVHNYSGSPALSTSGATVEVYRGNTRIATFAVPNAAGDLWTVFTLNGATLTPVNQMGSSSGQLAPGAGTAGVRSK